MKILSKYYNNLQKKENNYHGDTEITEIHGELVNGSR